MSSIRGPVALTRPDGSLILPCCLCDRAFKRVVGLIKHLASAHVEDDEDPVTEESRNSKSVEEHTPYLQMEVETSPEHTTWTEEHQVKEEPANDTIIAGALVEAAEAEDPLRIGILNTSEAPGCFPADGTPSEDSGLVCVESFTCQFCSKSFSSRSGCQRHEEIEHPNQSEYACNLCGKTFSIRAHCKAHIETMHFTVMN